MSLSMAIASVRNDPCSGAQTVSRGITVSLSDLQIASAEDLSTSQYINAGRLVAITDANTASAYVMQSFLPYPRTLWPTP